MIMYAFSHYVMIERYLHLIQEVEINGMKYKLFLKTKFINPITLCRKKKSHLKI